MNNKSIALVDVMNSKSSNHFRHSVDSRKISNISFYYAMESRVFNGVWDEVSQKYIKGKLWFTNLMVFDFDFDEKHYPNIKDYEEKLNQSITKLEQILGKPKYKIFNKESFSDFEKEVYFTKSLPKKYGCQVVYVLKDSVKSQYKEVVKLYSHLRTEISKKVDADINFKGHMFKNFYNKDLFNIIENKDFDEVDIFNIASNLCESYDKDKIEKVKNLGPFESLEKKLPNNFKKLNNDLVRFYDDLNSWKRKNNFKKENESFNNYFKSESRNETLFNFLRSLTEERLKSFDYNDLLKANIFSHCIETECLEEQEFISTKQSVLAYKEINIEEYSSDSKFDDRVFKFEQEPINLNFYEENSEKFALSIKIKPSLLSYKETKISVKSYSEDKKENLLANMFLSFGPDIILKNIKSLITPDFATFVNNKFCNSEYGLYDIFNLIKQAIFLTHFKYYYSIQDFRHSKKIIVTKENNTFDLRKSFGFYFNGKTKDFKNYYNNLKKNNYLKEDGTPYPISFYQSVFHIKNTHASVLVKDILIFLSFKEKMNQIKLNRNLKVSSRKQSFLILFFIMIITTTSKNNIFSIIKIIINYDISYHSDEYNNNSLLKMNNLLKEIKMNNVLFDVETTGLNPLRCSILSIGALISKPNEQPREFYEILNWCEIIPDFKIPEDSIKIHGITYDIMKKHGINPIQVFCDLRDFLVCSSDIEVDCDIDVAVAFNLPFDINMIRSNLLFLTSYAEEHKINSFVRQKLDHCLKIFTKSYSSRSTNNKILFIDSMIIDRILHFEVDGVKVRHDLDSVGKRYGLVEDANAHNALADTRRLAKIWELQIEELKKEKIEIDNAFEDRLINKFNAEQAKWNKKDIDYFGYKVGSREL